MSDLSTTNLSLSNLGTDAGISSFNTAEVPADIRDGDSTAREAYVEGLAFEDVLVKQFAQQMVATSSSTAGLDSSDPSDDGSGSSDSSSTGGLFGSSGSSFASMIPDTLANAIMSNGGLGIAAEIAQSIDPALARSSSADTKTGSDGSGSQASSATTSGGSGLTGNAKAAS